MESKKAKKMYLIFICLFYHPPENLYIGMILTNTVFGKVSLKKRLLESGKRTKQLPNTTQKMCLFV